MGFWKRLFEALTPGSRIVLYVATNESDLFRVTGQLINAGVPYTVKSPLTARPQRGGFLIGERAQIYEIYVKPEHEYQALRAISSGNR
ncbi:hypothetical protein [Cohnella candidum]|uniref:DUF2007 domain-containing protein n=1 Tax=Cohnella candidum TaxID=2674991 RepID=A0A3G3JXQ6_9BACL|nr:hypothetical protein [Cohnella candidum]AYQ72299.1 hypothetical protein EAV92_06785 [Cohnella candidum]